MIKDFLTNRKYTSLDGIYTFGKYLTLQKESLPSHSWYVSLFTSMLFDNVFKDYYSNQHLNNLLFLEFKSKCLVYAIMHDYPENFTGDISFETKYNEYNGKRIKELIDEYEDIVMEREILNNQSFETLHNAYYDEHVKSFVKIADWLATICKEIREIQLGNSQFKTMIEISFVSIIESIDNFIKVNDYRFDLNTDYFESLKQDLQQIQIEILK